MTAIDASRASKEQMRNLASVWETEEEEYRDLQGCDCENKCVALGVANVEFDTHTVIGCVEARPSQCLCLWIKCVIYTLISVVCEFNT